MFWDSSKVRSVIMNERGAEDAGTISRAEITQAKGKEIDVSPFIRKVSGHQERDCPIPARDPGSSVNVESSQNPSTSYVLDNSTRNEDNMFFESIMNKFQPSNEPGFGSEAGNLYEHPAHTMKESTSSAAENLRFQDHAAGKTSDNHTNLNPGQSSYNLSSAALQISPSFEDMRKKVLSKYYEYPEDYVKNTLMAKGSLYRGSISNGAETPLVNFVAEKPILLSSHVTSSFDHGDIREPSPLTASASTHAIASWGSLNDEISLRDWIKSGKSENHKADCLFIFKQILDLVCSFHSKGKVMADLLPSSFRLFPSRKVKYCERVSAQTKIDGSVMHKDAQRLQTLKRPLEQGMPPYFPLGAKHQKRADNVKCSKKQPKSQLGYEAEHRPSADSRVHLPTSSQPRTLSVVDQLEEKWYTSPEELFGWSRTSSSNVYSLGVFLFELLCSFDSTKEHVAAMSNLHHRLLPPNFLSGDILEAGFCLWLMQPVPSLRPTTRDVVSGLQAICGDDESSIQKAEEESVLLSDFLTTMKERKKKHASKLVKDLRCIEADITELQKRHKLRKSASFKWSKKNFYSRFSKNVGRLENAYFTMRSTNQGSKNDPLIRADRDILKSRRNEEQEGSDSRGAFFDGLCKYARYSKLEVCGTVRNRDIISITNSTNVICSLSVDRDEDYFAAAGLAKKIKVFEFQSLYDNAVDVHYPLIEMKNKSKLSCVCWNKYIRNYLASTDYDGFVKLWDATTGQSFSQYTEHTKRAWSVDFCQVDPTLLASGSDDCCVKLWSINEKKCLNTIRSIANVCCVEFSAHSPNLLAFGSVDCKIYCYDLRNANVPWCVLAGHKKAISYVKFVDSSTLVSASTDNTLKLWDLNKSSSVDVSNDACSLTLGGHTNEKNFVGLTVVDDGYIACGSETNEVYTYYKSLPMPITSHKFATVDPLSGKETDDDHRQFVSSVCCKGKSNVVVAANSSGFIKVLRMV